MVMIRWAVPAGAGWSLKCGSHLTLMDAQGVEVGAVFGGSIL